MMACGMAEDPRTVIDTAAFFIFRPVIEPPDAGKGNCARAHRARLKGDVEIATSKPL